MARAQAPGGKASGAGALLFAVLVLAGAAPAATLAPGPLAFACDEPRANLPCNLRMTFAPNEGNENYVALNPLDPKNLVATAKDYGLTSSGAPACDALNVWTGFYTTKDGGQTWSNGYAPGFHGDAPNPISGYRCSTDPVVAFDDQGTAYLSGLAYNSSGQRDAIWVAKSYDGGLTFPELAIADERSFNDKNWLAVDPESRNVYVTWTLFTTGNGIWFRRALAGDITTWDAALKLSGASSGSAQGSFPVVGPGGEVYVSWNDNILGGPGCIYLVQSTDGGKSFTPERCVLRIDAASWNGDAEYRTPTIPQLAVDRSQGSTRGNLYLVWQDKSDGDPDVRFSRSLDQGATWSEPVRLNDDAVGNGKGQNFPAIAVDASNGWVHVVWYDRRDDDENRLLNVYYAVSKDGGATWSPNQRVTTHSSVPTPCKHQSGATFIGDYMGLAAAGGKARPAFVDTRNERCDLYTALLFASPRVEASVAPHVNVTVPLVLPVTAEAWTPLESGVLEIDLPTHWSIEDAAGGTVVPGDGINTVRWSLRALEDRVTLPLVVTPTKSTVVTLEARLDWSLSVEGVAQSGRASWSQVVLVSYPVLELGLVAPERVARGTAYNLTLVVENVGWGPASLASLVLAVPQGAVPLPRGASATPEPPAAGLTYGKPPSDPALPPAERVAWSLPVIEPQSRAEFKLALLGPAPATFGTPGPRVIVHEATLTATAPDEALLQAARSAASALRNPGSGDLAAQAAVLQDYYAG